MKKFCIFCGKPPINKNREHLLPSWLLEMTGSSERMGNFGPYLNNNSLMMKRFPFKAFILPSCYDCNHKFGQIEDIVKLIMSNLLNEKPLDSSDFNYLLTWFDKIRIGSALASIYHLKNIYNIQPHYFIMDGAMKSDRLLLIYKSSHEFKCLNVFGVGLSFLMHYPICIGMVINNFGFINISKSFLLHKALGMPFPEIDPIYTLEEEIRFLKGPSIFNYPIIEYNYDKDCTEIYQSILSNDLRRNQVANAFYALSDYTKIFPNKSSLIGNILYTENLKIKQYPKKKSKKWIPKEKPFNFGLFQHFIAYQTLQIQNSFLKKGLELKGKISDSNLALLQDCLDNNNLNLKKLPLYQKFSF